MVGQFLVKVVSIEIKQQLLFHAGLDSLTKWSKNRKAIEPKLQFGLKTSQSERNSLMWVVIIAVDEVFIYEVDFKPNKGEERQCCGGDDEGEGDNGSR